MILFEILVVRIAGQESQEVNKLFIHAISAGRKPCFRVGEKTRETCLRIT